MLHHPYQPVTGTILSGSVPSSGAGSRTVQRHANRRLAHSFAAVLPHRVFLQLLAVLAVALGLLNLSGCAGGFQGYSPVAPTVTQPASITVPTRPDRNVQCLRHRNRHHYLSVVQKWSRHQRCHFQFVHDPAHRRWRYRFTLYSYGHQLRGLGYQPPCNSYRPASPSAGQEPCSEFSNSTL